MEDIKQIQEFFSKPLEENIVVRMYNTTDKTADLYKEDNPGLEFYLTGKEGQDYVRKYKDHISFPFSSHMNDGTPIPNYEENKEKLAAYLKQKGIPFKTTSAKPYRGVSRTTGEDFMYTTDTFKVPLSHVDIKDISLNENKVTKEDFNKVVQILGKSKYPFTIMLVPKWDEIDIITGQDSPDEIVDDIGQRLDSAGLNWGGNSGITVSGDSSNYSRKEYSDIFRVNGGHKDYFEESANEAKINRKKLSDDLWDRKGYDYKYLDKLSDKKLKSLWDTEFFYEPYMNEAKGVNEMDINDPILMKMRAAKDKLAKMRAANAGDDGNDEFFRNAKKIAFLKKERAQLMRDMEQEAEPEGGPIADEYGNKLNRIDAAIAKLSGRKEMTYDQAIAEGKGKMPTQDQVDRFFELTQNETHYLNSKPVEGQEKTFNLMKVEPWDEYDLSNWNSLVRKAKQRGKSIDENDKASTIKDKIEKLRKLSNSGEIDGDEFLDKFNPLQKQLKSIDEDNSYARVSKPRFKKDKNSPNFLNVYIDYDLGPGGNSIAFGKETMSGQIRRESAAEARKVAHDIALDLEANFDLEDIEVTDLENGKVRIFAVSDDFIDMDPNMLGEIKESLNPEVSNALNRFIKAMAKRYDYSEQDAVYAIMAALKQRDFDGVNEATEDEENEFHKDLDKLVHKTFGHSSDEKKKSMAQELAETIKLGEGVIEEELCPKGKAYIKKRKAAGEKSSAYLSGRAVKVCKGQMSGRKKKK